MTALYLIPLAILVLGIAHLMATRRIVKAGRYRGDDRAARVDPLRFAQSVKVGPQVIRPVHSFGDN